MAAQTNEEAVAEIRQLFRETDAQFKEIAARFKETDTKFKETDEGEVKSQLTVEWINDSLNNLAEFHHFFPKYKGYRLYGAVAGLNVAQDGARYAYRRGLSVLSITGNDMVQLQNDTKCKPRDFGQ